MFKIIIFLKGMLMGICDIIPGISGGTIAFITGIYVRLINAINSFNLEIVKDFFLLLKDRKHKERFFDDVKKLDLIFLITLFSGVIISILLGSKIVLFLLDEYFVLTISFFIGLIMASAKFIFDNIKEHNIKNYIICIVGFVIGSLFSILIPVDINPSLFYVFIGGFVAISAMFLPGISGAFILLIMGIYEFMINVIHNIRSKFDYLIVFLLGAGIGALTISKIITFLFRKDKCATLYFLLGLIIGSLSVPLKKIFISTPSWSFSLILFSLLLFLAGIIVVLFVTKLDKRKRKV